jgi:general transcriptional corepressor TUP1
VRLWDLQTGQLVHHLTGHTGCVSSVAFTPDGTGLISGSEDVTAKHWDLGPLLRNMHRRVSRHPCEEGGEDVDSVLKEKGEQNECLCTVAFRGHEVRRRLLHLHLLLTLLCSLSALVNLHSSRIVILMSVMQGDVTSVAVSHDHQWLVSGSTDQSVRFWDLRTGEEQLILRGHTTGGTFQRVCVCVRATH